MNNIGLIFLAAGNSPALNHHAVEVVQNPLWQLSMGTSIQTGIAALAGRLVDGIILALADQPLVTSAVLRSLVEAHRSSGKPIIASQYACTAGVPVYFGAGFFSALLALAPAQGCKGVIMGNHELVPLIDCPEAEVDVDTPEDYRRIAV